jgi:phosphopantetheinyl transferase (holo-ACP synthase)
VTPSTSDNFETWSRAALDSVDAWNHPDRLVDTERHYCERQRRTAEHVAARVLAKSLLLEGLELEASRSDEDDWQAIVVERNERGAPHPTLSGRPEREATRRGWRRIHLSLTHTASRVAAAVVVVMARPDAGNT